MGDADVTVTVNVASPAVYVALCSCATVMVVEPTATGVITPAADTVATPVLFEVYVTVVEVLFLSVTYPDISRVLPISTEPLAVLSARVLAVRMVYVAVATSEYSVPS